MKVRISYGIDLEEVPSKVKDLISAAGEALEEQSKILNGLPVFLKDGGGMLFTARQLDAIRKSLADLDTTLADAQAIAEGWVTAKTNPPPQPSSEPEDVYGDPMDNLPETESQPDVRKG